MKKTVFLAFFMVFVFGLLPLQAEEPTMPRFETDGKPDGNGARLFRFFIDKFQPESMIMTLDEEPDDGGNLRRIFIDVTGAHIDEMRIDHIAVEALDTDFTPVSDWAENGVEVRQMLRAYTDATLLEKDINDVVQKKTFGKDDDHWQHISIDFRNGGIHAQGNYVARFLFTFDILIEIDGVLDIVNREEIWIDDYILRVNRRDVPQWLTEKAIGKIQPILDLGKFVFPLRLYSIEQSDDRVHLTSRVLPKPFEGITYRYTESDNEE